MRTPDKFHRLLRSRRIRGQGMTEYIIIVALIAIGAVGAIGYFGTAVNSSFVALGSTLTGGDSTAKDAVQKAAKAEAGKAATATTLGTY